MARKIPKEVHDGNWWYVPAFVDVECPNCGEVTKDRPAIMRYIELRDFGVSRPEDPEWADYGWKVWWDCGACGRTWHKKHPNNYATEEEILSWFKPLRWEKVRH